jgi:hypothetical protein
MPYLVAFEDITSESPWFWFEVIVDSFFFLDILIILNTAYYNIKYELVTDRKAIFMNYFRGMLLIDIIAIFPFYAFESTSDNSSRSNKFVRLLRIARLTRIFRASKILNMV